MTTCVFCDEELTLVDEVVVINGDEAHKSCAEAAGELDVEEEDEDDSGE